MQIEQQRLPLPDESGILPLQLSGNGPAQVEQGKATSEGSSYHCFVQKAVTASPSPDSSTTLRSADKDV